MVAAVMLALGAASFGQERKGTLQTGKSIVELQSGRQVERVEFIGATGQRGVATLSNLSPTVNAWLLLSLQWPNKPETSHYHLENADPVGQRVALDPEHSGQLLIARGASTERCALWSGDALEKARRTMLAFAPLCGGKLYLRNAVRGNRSTLEASTEFLRDHVWAGEQIIGFVRREFYRDAFVERARPASAPASSAGPLAPHGAPGQALMKAQAAQRPVAAEHLGIAIADREGLRLGQWYAASGFDGVFVSVVQAGSVDVAPRSAAEGARPLDAVEAEALNYLIAFDLDAFELGFALGTEHPRLAWSRRVRDDQRDAQWPGPDGIGGAAPLARTGMVSPAWQARVAATFTGGFKREHGAFRFGNLAAVNHGSHYGFIELGVVFSALQPGLSTVYVLNDGSFGMKTWTLEDNRLLGQIRHARQNGVPLIERGPAGGPSRIGALVDQWGPGNWSGSSDEKLRSLRAGACLIEQAERQFLVYGYFSAATPRAMAQVFRAYGCRYAMHLDMNALEHTYMALYPRKGAQIGVEHLVRGMAALDKTVGATLLPRFLGFADDRDFFYLMQRKDKR